MILMLDVNYFCDKYLGEYGGLVFISYGDKYGLVLGCDLFFMIDKYDYFQKEIVVCF